jgi:uncharacterized membrane protein YbjE (DUF340 family)
MLAELGCLAAGVIPGHLLRKNKAANKLIRRGAMLTIYALLFVLGARLGGDEQLFSSLSHIGLQGLVLGFSCTMGSALGVYKARKFFAEEAKHAHNGPDGLPRALSGSLFILCCFIIGTVASRSGFLPEAAFSADVSLYILLAMLFLVGAGVGGDLKSLGIVRFFWPHALLIPLLTVAGTMAGACLSAPLLNLDLRSCLAVGSGFGYYSLASVLTTEMAGTALGSVSLIANIFRELFCLLATPLLARLLGPLSAVAAAGAPAMDTCLPVISRFTGERFAIIAVFNGLVITMLVPFLIALTLKFFA